MHAFLSSFFSRAGLKQLPRVQPLKVLTSLLVMLALLATASWSDWAWSPIAWASAVLQASLLYLGGSVVMLLLQQFGVAPSRQSENRIITLLILFLLFAPDVPWWGFLVLGAVTEGIQRLWRLPTGPWVNPAAAGTLVSALLLSQFGVLATWWGVSFSPRWYVVSEGLSLATLLLLPVAAWVVLKYRKMWSALSLLVAASLTYWLVFGVAPTYLLLEGTLLFFALVMAVEPKTSPVLRNDQLWFGALVGVLLGVLLRLYFIEAYAGALVLGNLAWNGTRWWKLRKVRQMAKARAAPSGGTTSLPGSTE